MKKLLFPILVTTMLIIFFGCKSDTPVQANDDTSGVISLQKSLHLSVLLQGNQVVITWQHYGGAAYFKLFETAGQGWTLINTVDAVPGQKNYEYDLDVSEYQPGIYNFQIQVYNKKDVMMTYYSIAVEIN